MSTQRAVAKAFVGLGSATIVVTALGLVRTKVVTTTLTPSDYGAFSLLLSVFGAFHVVGSLGLGTGMRRQAALNPERADDVLGSAATVSMIAGLVLMVGGVGLGWVSGDAVFDHRDGNVLAALAALAIPLVLLDGLWLDALYSRGSARAAGAFVILARGWSVLSLGILCWQFGLVGAAAGFALGFLPSAGWGFLSRQLKAKPLWPPVFVRQLLRDGALNQSIIVTNSLTTVAVRFIVLHAAGATRLGLLAVAFGLAGQLTAFSGAGVAGTIFNQYAASGGGDRDRVLRQGVVTVAVVAVGLAAVGAIAMPVVLPILTSEAYAGAVAAGRLALAGAAIESVFYVYGNAMFLEGMMARYLLTQNVGNVVFLSGALLFRMDIELVVVAYAAGQAVSLGMAALFLCGRGSGRPGATGLPLPSAVESD